MGPHHGSPALSSQRCFQHAGPSPSIASLDCNVATTPPAQPGPSESRSATEPPRPSSWIHAAIPFRSPNPSLPIRCVHRHHRTMYVLVFRQQELIVSRMPRQRRRLCWPGKIHLDHHHGSKGQRARFSSRQNSLALTPLLRREITPATQTTGTGIHPRSMPPRDSFGVVFFLNKLLWLLQQRPLPPPLSLAPIARVCELFVSVPGHWYNTNTVHRCIYTRAYRRGPSYRVMTIHTPRL